MVYNIGFVEFILKEKKKPTPKHKTIKNLCLYSLVKTFLKFVVVCS